LKKKYKMKTLAALISSLWRSKRILFLTTFVELKKRHAGSVLGVGWVLFYPALLLGMYMFIYQVVFRVKITGIDSPFEYSLFVLCGIIPYLAFAEVMNSSILTLSQNRHLITNVIVPMELLPVRVVLVALVSQCMSMGILIALLLLAGNKVSVYWLYVPVMFMLQFLFLAGLAFIFSALGVLLRDLAQFMAILTLFLLFVSPVGYTKEMVPETLRIVLYANPVWYLADSFREPLLYGCLPDWDFMLIYATSALAFFLGGGFIFKKTLYSLSDLA